LLPNRSLLPPHCVSFDTGHTHTYLTLSNEGQRSIDLADSKKQSHLDSENGKEQPPCDPFSRASSRCEDFDARAPTLIDVDGDGFIDAEDVDILSEWLLFRLTYY
jgi:hypothetical protein